jgi:hypothetical protein
MFEMFQVIQIGEQNSLGPSYRYGDGFCQEVPLDEVPLDVGALDAPSLDVGAPMVVT